MSAPDSPYLESGQQEYAHDYAELGHKLTDKKLREWTTEIRNPTAMSTLDTAVMGLIKEEFSGTGFDKDMEKWRDWLRDNMIAKDRGRAGELERIASAAAQREQERNAFREKLLGSLER